MVSFEEWFNTDTERLAKKLSKRPDEKYGYTVVDSDLKFKLSNTVIPTAGFKPIAGLIQFVDAKGNYTFEYMNQNGVRFSAGDCIRYTNGAAGAIFTGDVYRIIKFNNRTGCVDILLPPTYANTWSMAFSHLDSMEKV